MPRGGAVLVSHPRIRAHVPHSWLRRCRRGEERRGEGFTGRRGGGEVRGSGVSMAFLHPHGRQAGPPAPCRGRRRLNAKAQGRRNGAKRQRGKKARMQRPDEPKDSHRSSLALFAPLRLPCALALNSPALACLMAMRVLQPRSISPADPCRGASAAVEPRSLTPPGCHGRARAPKRDPLGVIRPGSTRNLSPAGGPALARTTRSSQGFGDRRSDPGGEGPLQVELSLAVVAAFAALAGRLRGGVVRGLLRAWRSCPASSIRRPREGSDSRRVRTEGEGTEGEGWGIRVRAPHQGRGGREGTPARPAGEACGARRARPRGGLDGAPGHHTNQR